MNGWKQAASTTRRTGLGAGLAVLLSLAALAGCAEQEPRMAVVNLSGTILLPGEVADTDSVVTVNLYHAWALEGELRHPVEFIGSFATTAGEYRHVFEYPVDAGEGLLVYAWVDLDGDGVNCTPAARIDLAGLTEVADFSFGDVIADVDMDTPCAGPDWFYPPVSD